MHAIKGSAFHFLLFSFFVLRQMFRLLFFFFIGGVQAIFGIIFFTKLFYWFGLDCQETSTTLSGEGCHFQFFTDVGPDFNCSNTV